MWTRRIGYLLSFSLMLTPVSRASNYLEFGLGVATFKKADSYFGTSVSNAGGFAGNFSAYWPILYLGDLARMDLGFQTRISCASDTSGGSLSFASTNLSTRIEFWRFFIGAGASPITFYNTQSKGILGLHPYPGTLSYFLEGGAFWRVAPEFQIIASAALESASASSGLSPSPITEFSLRFRFPLNPKESTSRGAGFDGYRYPFGIMK
jgi:hypothetical protein